MGFFEEQLLKRPRNFIGSHLPSNTIQGETSLLIAYHGDEVGCYAAYFLKKYAGIPAMDK